MDEEQKLALIKRNMAESVKEYELKTLLKEKKSPAVYLGTAITGKPHIGYFAWVVKMADFLDAGFKVKVLLADLHGALDNCPWPVLEKRYQYYNLVIPALFEAIGIKPDKLQIVKGSDFQLSKEYMYDMLKLTTLASEHDCRKASSEVVKQTENPKLSGLLYPIMQALDEEYLKVDIQYGGIDQRKILMFAREYLPKIGYMPRIEVMTPLIPGLVGEKMSASKEESKIDLLDDKKAIEQKLKRAYCPEAQLEGNGVMAFAKYVVMVLKEKKGSSLVIQRPAKFGGTVKYDSYAALENDYCAKKLHPMDLKAAMVDEIDALLAPIRKKCKGKEQLVSEAYPA